MELNLVSDFLNKKKSGEEFTKGELQLFLKTGYTKVNDIIDILLDEKLIEHKNLNHLYIKI